MCDPSLFFKEYGCGTHKKKIAESGEDKLVKMAELDETSIHMHQIKLLFANGMGWGLRGATEHSKLEVMHVAKGYLEERHQYAGMPWLGYDHLTDKSHVLSTRNGWVREYKVSFFLLVHIVYCECFTNLFSIIFPDESATIVVK